MSVQMKESSLAIHREVENRMSQAFKKKKAFISEKV